MHFTHLNQKGEAHMVDVGDKSITQRQATASCRILLARETMDLLLADNMPKGDVFATARIAGIQAAKKTSDLIPLCHPLALNSVTVDFDTDSEKSEIKIFATCKVSGKTGVEMEALTAASVTALTFYDMCKAVVKGMQITELRLEEKLGGRSGHWQREENG